MARQSAIRSAANLLRRLRHGTVSRMRDGSLWARDIAVDLIARVRQRIAEVKPPNQGPIYTPDVPKAPPVLENTPQAAPAELPEGIVVYAVGDVHGRADLLQTLFQKIDADAEEAGGRVTGAPSRGLPIKR